MSAIDPNRTPRRASDDSRQRDFWGDAVAWRGSVPPRVLSLVATPGLISALSSPSRTASTPRRTQSGCGLPSRTATAAWRRTCRCQHARGPGRPGPGGRPEAGLVVADGGDYVFVAAGDGRHTFERRAVRVDQEKDDHAVIGEGLRPGEPVVVVGALILAQYYENLRRANSAGTEARGRDR